MPTHLDDDRDALVADDAPELPRRPRNRLLTPVPVALLVMLMTACGFIGGVLVEKGQGTSTTGGGSASALAAALARLRSGAQGAGASGGSGAGGSGALAERARSLLGGQGPGGATVGQVSFVHGGTLYVTDGEGNTVTVTTSPASTVTKTVKASVQGIHPGETVIVQGAKGANGAIAAESIRVSEGGGAGIGALFGAGGGPGSPGGATRAGGAGGAKGGAGGGGEGPPLFGPGGGESKSSNTSHPRRRDMSNQINRPHPAVISVLALSACIGLAACGGSSTSSTSANAAAAGPAAGASGPDGGRGAARFGAMRECLQKNGITLPRRLPGQARPFGGFPGGGPRLPSGVTREQFEAALKKCGAPGGRFGRFGATERLRNPAFVQALTKFATCMRENGIDVPAPNTSGNGPVFNTRGMDTASPGFRAAFAKCRSDLRRSFGPPGAGTTGAG